MKIAVTSTGPTLEDRVEMHFSRCPYFLIVDMDTMSVESIPNPHSAPGGSAGPKSADLIADKGVSTVLTGRCGDNALRAFGNSGIAVITGVSGIIRDTLEQFKAGRWSKPDGSDVQETSGSGGRRIGGMGGGRGMGGRGRGMGGGGRGTGRCNQSPGNRQQR